MPTITITSPALTAPRRRSAALKITRWLAERGIPPGHVVVRFETARDGQLYSGGWPVDTFAGPPDALPYAAVTCCIDPRRDDAFRYGLARHVADVLGLTDRTSFFYFEYRPTRPSDAYVATAGSLRRTDQIVPAPGSKDG